jgi:hypothetical protein
VTKYQILLINKMKKNIHKVHEFENENVTKYQKLSINKMSHIHVEQIVLTNIKAKVHINSKSQKDSPNPFKFKNAFKSNPKKKKNHEKKLHKVHEFKNENITKYQILSINKMKKIFIEFMNLKTKM